MPSQVTRGPSQVTRSGNLVTNLATELRQGLLALNNCNEGRSAWAKHQQTDNIPHIQDNQVPETYIVSHRGDKPRIYFSVLQSMVILTVTIKRSFPTDYPHMIVLTIKGIESL